VNVETDGSVGIADYGGRLCIDIGGDAVEHEIDSDVVRHVRSVP
jgi:hypothetical protein